MKTRVTKRFVNELRNHKQEFISSDELLADFQESGRSEFCEERKVTKKARRKLGRLQARRKLVQTLSAPLLLRHPYSQKNHSYD